MWIMKPLRKPGKPHHLEPGTYTIGRSEDNNITLPIDEVSRYHAEIVLHKSGGHIRDLDSLNGTYLNGEKITSSSFKHGDEISFGRESSYSIEFGDLNIVQSVPPTIEPSHSRHSVSASAEQIEKNRCPYCESEIPARAKKCKFCGEWVDKNAVPKSPKRKQSIISSPQPSQNIKQDFRQDVNIQLDNRSNSPAFAIITCICYIFVYPLGLLLNAIGLLTGPRRGCFSSLIIFFFIIPIVIVWIMIDQGVKLGLPFLDSFIHEISKYLP